MAAGVFDMAEVVLELPDEVLSLITQNCDPALGFKQRLAVALYAEGALSISSAALLADMPYMDFWEPVTSLGLGPKYTEQHYAEDTKALKERGLL
jgi:predicted HTH domain antitoxin